MRRSLEPAQLYTLLAIVVVGVPATAFLLLGAPDLALPSDWSEARARINDGTYPTGAVINIASVVFLLAWGGSLWLLVSSLLNRDRTISGGTDPDDGFEAGPDFGLDPSIEADPNNELDAGFEGDPTIGLTPSIEADEPWSRQGDPTLGEQLSDDHLGVAPADDTTLDSVRGSNTTAADGSVAHEMLTHDGMHEAVVSDAMAHEAVVSDAEIIGHSSGASPDEPPMIVPVRAYYFTRAEDTLRSISAQFLQSPRRWEELRALNAASPGVATAGPDTQLPLGTALALPGDPLPWGKPDPVYLWTLAEKFLFTAWGREPTPEEVAPFWRGLTSGSQLEAGTSARPQHLAAPESATTPTPALQTAPAPAPTPPPPETVPAPPPEHQPAPAPPEHQPAPAPPEHQPAPAPPEHQPAPPEYQPAPPEHQPPPAPPEYQPAPPEYQPPPAPPPPEYQPAPIPATYEPSSPLPPGPGSGDVGPVEPEAPSMEAEVARMPTFMPSLMGAEAAAPAAEAQVVSSANRSLAGTAIGDAMMLLQLSRIRRRGGRQTAVVDPIEESLKQSARVDTLNLIEAAMRHLRAVTVGRLREKPAVLAVRVGTYGFEVLLSRPIEAPEGWQTASLGHVLELPQGVTVEDLDAVGQGPSLCPALVPVGDTLEGPLLLNIEEIGCLIVSGPGSPSVNLLNAIVGTLGTSPLAGDIRIIVVGMDVPAGLVGWEKVHSTSFDSPQLEELLTTAQTGSGASLDVLVVGPGNDLLIQRAGQVATTPGSRLALVGNTSSVAARWPWRIHVDETTTAIVHPIACTMAAAQVKAPAMTQLLSEVLDPALLAPPRF